MVQSNQLLLKLAQLCCFVFQSETAFNLISEKCDILSILRDHPENRIYQRKIQVRRGSGGEDARLDRLELGAEGWCHFEGKKA